MPSAQETITSPLGSPGRASHGEGSEVLLPLQQQGEAGHVWVGHPAEVQPRLAKRRYKNIPPVDHCADIKSFAARQGWEQPGARGCALCAPPERNAPGLGSGTAARPRAAPAGASSRRSAGRAPAARSGRRGAGRCGPRGRPGIGRRQKRQAWWMCACAKCRREGGRAVWARRRIPHPELLLLVVRDPRPGPSEVLAGPEAHRRRALLNELEDDRENGVRERRPASGLLEDRSDAGPPCDQGCAVSSV